MAEVLDKPKMTTNPIDEHADLMHTWEWLYDKLHGRRVEIINERIVISPVPGPKPNRVIYALHALLLPLLEEKGWELWPDIPLFLGPTMDRYRPDLTVMPSPDNPPLWGENEVHGNGVFMVVEVVSKGSQDDDHRVKPAAYAGYGVPNCLIIDMFDQVIRLLGHPAENGYRTEVKTAFGEKLDLPEPLRITLDTARLLAVTTTPKAPDAAAASDVGDA